MKIDGRLLGNKILKQLANEASIFNRRKVIPHLGVIYVGNDSATLSFIRQKTKAASTIGAELSLCHFKKTPLYQKIAESILKLDQNANIHGIIIQRPLPPTLSAPVLTKRMHPIKDVDGFLAKSYYLPPIGISIFKILNEIYYTYLKKTHKPKDDFNKTLLSWLKTQNIVLIGKGETGGKPIAQVLQKNRINFIMINSTMQEKEEYLTQADIIISAVGKSNIVKPEDIKKDVILIGVGIHREKDKLVGDYDEKKIAKIASFFTPTPGGVGPVNVASLMQNLIDAGKRQIK